MPRTEEAICVAVSARESSTASVRRRAPSASVLASPRLATARLIAASCSCEAPAASWPARDLLHRAAKFFGRGGRLGQAACEFFGRGSQAFRNLVLGGWWPHAWLRRSAGRCVLAAEFDGGRAGARTGGLLGGGAVPTVSLDFLTSAMGFPGTMRIARDGTQSHAYRPLDGATLMQFTALSKADDPPDDGASRHSWTPRLRRHRASGPCFSRLLACASSSLA